MPILDRYILVVRLNGCLHATAHGTVRLGIEAAQDIATEVPQVIEHIVGVEHPVAD